MVERYKYNELDYAGIYVRASDYDALAAQLADARRHAVRMASLVGKAYDAEFAALVRVLLDTSGSAGSPGEVEAERNARLVGVLWAIDQGYIGRDYADDALRAADSASGG